jgi:hypothetical protein
MVLGMHALSAEKGLNPSYTQALTEASTHMRDLARRAMLNLVVGTRVECNGVDAELTSASPPTLRLSASRVPSAAQGCLMGATHMPPRLDKNGLLMVSTFYPGKPDKASLLAKPGMQRVTGTIALPPHANGWVYEELAADGQPVQSAFPLSAFTQKSDANPSSHHASKAPPDRGSASGDVPLG